MTFLNWLISTIGTTAVLGFALFLARTFIIEKLSASIKYTYDKELETHKANLKRDYDVQIVQLKAQLQIANVRFSHIFVKQAEVIVATHEKLIPLLDATYKYIEAAQNQNVEIKAERGLRLQDLRNEFHTFFRINRIYLPNDSAKLVHNFINTLNHYQSSNAMLQTMFSMKVRSEHTEAQIDKFGKQIDELEIEVNNMMNALVDNFQNILGVYKEEKKIS